MLPLQMLSKYHDMYWVLHKAADSNKYTASVNTERGTLPICGEHTSTSQGHNMNAVQVVRKPASANVYALRNTCFANSST
jgi:hypothetical protein